MFSVKKKKKYGTKFAIIKNIHTYTDITNKQINNISEKVNTLRPDRKDVSGNLLMKRVGDQFIGGKYREKKMEDAHNKAMWNNAPLTVMCACLRFVFILWNLFDALSHAETDIFFVESLLFSL